MKTQKKQKTHRDYFHQKIEEHWPGVADILLASETNLQKVHRWGRFKRKEGFKTLRRPQNVLQHSYSIIILARILIEKISPHLPKHYVLDKDIILTCFSVHDCGEGELKRDICYGTKNGFDDVDEYNAFIERYKQLGPDVCRVFQKAFLLQFCLGDTSSFPDEAKKIMYKLKKERYFEALIFRATEIWEYLLYALEQNKNFANQDVLSNVLVNQVPQLNKIARDLPGFKEEIWRPELSDFFTAESEKIFIETII